MPAAILQPRRENGSPCSGIWYKERSLGRTSGERTNEHERWECVRTGRVARWQDLAVKTDKTE